MMLRIQEIVLLLQVATTATMVKSSVSAWVFTERPSDEARLLEHGDDLREDLPYKMYFDTYPWTKMTAKGELMEINPGKAGPKRQRRQEGHFMSLLCTRRNCGHHSTIDPTALHQQHKKRAAGENNPYLEAGAQSGRVTDAGYGSRINTANVLAKQHVTMNNHRNLFGSYGPGR